jgi:hypothetical protein
MGEKYMQKITLILLLSAFAIFAWQTDMFAGKELTELNLIIIDYKDLQQKIVMLKGASSPSTKKCEVNIQILEFNDRRNTWKEFHSHKFENIQKDLPDEIQLFEIKCQ